MPITRASGETYRVTPFVWQEAVSPIRSPGCDGSDGYDDRVEYEILQSPATFTWDPVKACFNTVVRNFSVGPTLSDPSTSRLTHTAGQIAHYRDYHFG